ncbi:hypothetical protein BDB01DRAFT_839092 [Pilobolus umbonatus]|nr:hypothetical protein BDB01DRAFT_839092 [Pilobolus umbonatus]
MRVITSMLTPTRMMLKAPVNNSLRYYTSAAAPKKSGSKLLFAALAGAGVLGGIYYNSPSNTSVKSAPKVPKNSAFNPKEFISLKLDSVHDINHDTKLFRFQIPENTIAGLPVASCVVTRHTADEKPVVRPYTPVSPSEAEGHVDFIIKRYENGKMTPYIHNMKPGDSLDFKGPFPKYDWEKEQKENVGMIAGGTGITPMLQVIRRVFAEQAGDKKTKISLIFANQTEEDILLKDELDQLAKEHPDRFKVTYILDKPSKEWTGHAGYVNAELIKANLPNPKEEDSIIFVCGPPPMVKSLAGVRTMTSQGELEGVLKELGYAQENVYKF